MASIVDDRWGIKKETTYGTAVTVDRFYPWVGSDVEGSWDNRRRTAEGLVGGGGRRAVLGSRSFLPTGMGMIKTKVELDSKGLGVLLDLALGVSTVTAITGGSQMNFHTGLSTGFLNSATIQVVKVMNTGTEYVETYRGCTAKKVTIEQPLESIPTAEIEWDALGITTVTAAATPAFPANTTMFDSSNAAGFLGGAWTAPTSNTLGTVGTAFADIKSWKLEIEQNLDVERWVLGGRNRPIAGVPAYTFEADAEFNAVTIPDLVLSGSRFPFACTWTTTETLGAGFTQLQVAVPQMGLVGDLAKVTIGETRGVAIKGEVTNNGTDRDIYVVYRTTDVAL
jgi:hypothetical protein